VLCGNGFDAGVYPLSKYSFEPIQCCSLRLGEDMRRREFISLLGGVAATLPRTVQAQERVRRVAVLMSTTSDEPESQARITALAQGLQEAGWAVGTNVRIDVRWSSGDLARVRKDAEELVALAPDVLVAGIGPTTQALQETTRTLPIVFAQAVDPVGLGIVKSMARPGGNATGFTQFEYSLSAKWLELLREVVPRVMRVGVVRDGRFAPVGLGQWAVIGLRRRRLGWRSCRSISPLPGIPKVR
jgi:putative ABC transport system substrate-binding protein